MEIIKMISYSIIQKSQLEGGLRLDAEYYQPEFLSLISKIKNQKSKFLGDIGEVVYGTTPSGGVFEEKGIPFIRSQNFSLLNISNDFVFCPEDFHKQNKKSKVIPGDILFAAVGATIGQLAIVQDEIKEANINQNIAAVKIKDKKFNPYFVGLFFASYFGQLQIERLVTGNAQFYLNTEQIKNFIIPSINKEEQDKIAKIFKNIPKELEISRNLYSQAENLLLEELGLKNFKIEDDLSYIVKLSEIKSVHRADAEYFQPKYERIISIIRKYGAKTIRELSELVGHATQAPYDEAGNIAVLAQKHMKRDLVIDTSVFDNYTTQGLIKKNDKKFILKNGDVLISSAGKPGLTCVWTDGYQKEVIPGSFVTIVRFGNKIESLYAGVFLNTVAGRLQFEREYTGSVQQYVYPVKIKEILIPVLPKPTQQKIADLVQKSHEARKKAKELLELVKQKVEKLIEK